MVNRITQDRWNKAQTAERGYHHEPFDEGYAHYAESYRQYFEHLGIYTNQDQKTICEIGPADFPALAYCYNFKHDSIIIEPLPSEYLKRFNLHIITEPAEDAVYQVDEVWLFNVLQHVINPYEIMERAKKQSKVIRFFEPINYGINDAHPWNLTMKMFKDWFGDSVQYWEAGQDVKNFHTWECCYGVYKTGIL